MPPRNGLVREGDRMVLYQDGVRYVAGAPIRPGSQGWQHYTDEKRGTTLIRGPGQKNPRKSLGAYAHTREGVIFVPGLGNLDDEELKDLVDRVREKNAKLAPEKAQQSKERRRAFHEAAVEAAQAKITYHKRNAVTDPGRPKHQKKVW